MRTDFSTPRTIDAGSSLIAPGDQLANADIIMCVCDGRIFAKGPQLLTTADIISGLLGSDLVKSITQLCMIHTALTMPIQP